MSRVLYIGDLHMGNENSSMLDFLKLLSKVRNRRYDEIIFLGDIIDGLEKYQTHKYHQYTETMVVQAEMLKWLIEFMNANMKYKKLVFILGNHDVDPRWGSLIDVELYSKMYGIEFYRHYIDSNKMLCLHQLAKSARVGSQSGWTPSMVDKAKTILMEYYEYGARGIVTAHVHKILDILYNSGYIFVLLPSFMTSGRMVAEDYIFKPSIVEMTEEGLNIYSTEFSDLKIIRMFNMRLVNEIMIDRSRIETFDDVEKIYKEVVVDYVENGDKTELVAEVETEKGMKYTLYYDRESREYVVYKNGEYYFRIAESKFNDVVRELIKKKPYNEIAYTTRVPRVYVGVLARFILDRVL